MMKRKRKTTVKGMTLIECIISLFVFGITALMMVTICTTVSRLLLNANHLNNRTIVEAPASSVKDIDKLVNPATGAPVVYTDADGNDFTADSPVAVEFTVSSNGYSDTLQANRYSTAVLAKVSDRDTTTNMDADLYFYDIQP